MIHVSYLSENMKAQSLVGNSSANPLSVTVLDDDSDFETSKVL